MVRATVCAVLLFMATTACSEELTYEKLIAMDNAPKVVTYKEVGEEKLHLYVYAPDGHKKTDKRPAILVIHGGGWESPGLKNMAHLCRYLALQGMVAINVQYRLVSRKTTVRIPDSMADCNDAFSYAKTHGTELGIDPKRIAVAGESAGGHLAAVVGLGMDPKGGEPAAKEALPNAVILYNPCVDLLGIPWMKGHAGVSKLADTPEGETWDVRAKRISPLEFVRKGLPPMLLIHGIADGCIPIKLSDGFAERMKKEGNAVTYHRMDGWNHAFMVPNCGPKEQVVKTIQLTDAFLLSLGYLQGKPILADLPALETPTSTEE
jgi:acetyl esterase